MLCTGLRNSHRKRRENAKDYVPAKEAHSWIKKMLIALMIGCLLLCAGAYFIAERLRPMICPIAVAEAKSIATMSINTAVNQELSVAEIGYDDLITLEMDAENRVTALKANTLEINKLRASLTVAIQSKVDQIQDSIVEIPWARSSTTNFSPASVRISGSSSRRSGLWRRISQIPSPPPESTRPATRSSSPVSATIAIVMPAATEYAQVETSIVLGESVLVGKVPQNYTNIGSSEDAEKWDQLINFLDLTDFLL